MEETLIVNFDNNVIYNETGLSVIRKRPNGDITVLKMVFGEQAKTLYKLLTDQSTFAEIKSESEVQK